MQKCLTAILFVLAGTILLPMAAHAEETPQERAQRETYEQQKLEQMRESLKAQDVAIAFYGRVLDQQDAPVEGVEVLVQMSQFVSDSDKDFQTAKKSVSSDRCPGIFRDLGREGETSVRAGHAKGGL